MSSQARSTPRAAVLGDGTMATAVAHVIASQERACTLWSSDDAASRAINEQHRHPRFFREITLAPHLVATTDLEEAVRGAALVVVAVPSPSFDEVARALGRVATEDQLLLSATKGLDPRSNKRMSELLREHTRATDVGAIGGANITPDIMLGQLTAILVASPRREALDLAKRMMATPSFRVFGSQDLIGVELVSALKNVAAIATGIAIGLNLGINTVSFVLTEALREVRELAHALGASNAPWSDLCGLADLYLTCTHPASLNRRVGIELGAGRTLSEILSGTQEVPEGINTLRAHLELARAHDVRSPIAEGVQRIMHGTLPASALADLLPCA